MAKRLIFRIDSNGIYEDLIDFKFFAGFAVSQKQKSINSLHDEIKKLYQGNIIEISSKSPTKLGINLSAFNLKVKISDRFVPLENIFQASKVFENGGPYVDLLHVSPSEAKRDQRIKTSGRIVSFNFNDKEYPIDPKTLFYDWIYCRALSHYPNLINSLKMYSIFTDIEFNHEKSINCQARSVAIFMYLYNNQLLSDALPSIESFETIAYKKFHHIYIKSELERYTYPF